MTLRRGLALALAVSAASVGGADAPARPADPAPRLEYLRTLRCGLVSLSVTRVLGGPPDALSVYVSDGTRRGTRLLGDIPAPLGPYFEFGGPVSGWTWIVGRNPESGGTSLWFTSPSVGVVEGFGWAEGALTTTWTRFLSGYPVQPTDRGLWLVLVPDQGGGTSVLRFQPFPNSDAAAGEWPLVEPESYRSLDVSGDVALFTQDGHDGAGREFWTVKVGDDRARRVTDFDRGENVFPPTVTAFSPPVVLCDAFDGLHDFREPWLVDIATGEARRVADLVGAEDPCIGYPNAERDGAILVVEEDAEQGAEPMIFSAKSGVLTATRLDLRSGPESSDPWTHFETRSVVSADDGVHGREPWVIDVPAGTAKLLDLVIGPPGSGPTQYAAFGSETVVAGTLPSGAATVWTLHGGGVSRIDELGDAFLVVASDKLLARGLDGRSERVLRRRTLKETGTFDAAAGLGFTDDVMIAMRRLASDPYLLTPAANGRARVAGPLEVRRLSTRRGSTDVEVLLPAPTQGDALSAGTWIVDVGGLVEGDFFAPGQARGGRGKGRIVRSIAGDGRVLVRARVVGGAPRRDGPGGTIPVLVWRETERFEGAAAPR